MISELSIHGMANAPEQIKDTYDTHLHYLLTAKFGIKVYGAYQEWYNETAEVLRSTEN